MIWRQYIRRGLGTPMKLIIRGNVVLPLVRAKNDAVGEIHVPWVEQHWSGFQVVPTPFWRWGLFRSCHRIYRFSRSGSLSRGFFGVWNILHIFCELARAGLNGPEVNIASSLRLASLSTPRSRYPWAVADAPGGLGSQAFSSGRFEWWPKELGSTNHPHWTHRPAPAHHSQANRHHRSGCHLYWCLLIVSTSRKSGYQKG